MLLVDGTTLIINRNIGSNLKINESSTYNLMAVVPICFSYTK